MVIRKVNSVLVYATMIRKVKSVLVYATMIRKVNSVLVYATMIRKVNSVLVYATMIRKVKSCSCFFLLQTRCQDILSHQSMIDSLSDKGSALSSTKVKGKLNQLNAKYGALCQAAQAQVKKAEDEVDQHQKLQDQHQQCRDWMAATKDKLAVCAEASGDKQAVQNRLDKVQVSFGVIIVLIKTSFQHIAVSIKCILFVKGTYELDNYSFDCLNVKLMECYRKSFTSITQDLVKSMRDGEGKIKAVHAQAQKIQPQTGAQGQAAIQRDLDGLTSDWEALANRMGDTQENLIHALEALTAYDGTCDLLNKWLRECEMAIKDIELKRTLGDKSAQVEKLKKLQQDVNARQRHFDELHDMVTHMQGADPRLINYSSQLNSRYETLKNNMRVSEQNLEFKGGGRV